MRTFTKSAQQRLSMSYPALAGDVVTLEHADYCERYGHGVHIIDGVRQDYCPRCGERRNMTVRFEFETDEYIADQTGVGFVGQTVRDVPAGLNTVEMFAAFLSSVAAMLGMSEDTTLDHMAPIEWLDVTQGYAYSVAHRDAGFVGTLTVREVI